MPKLEKIFTLEITPEQFLNACTPTELQEVELLISSRRFQSKMDDVPNRIEYILPESAMKDEEKNAGE